MSSTAEKKKSPSDELLKALDLWLQWDQCQETRKEIEQLKSESKWDDLEARLTHRIHFGTAGLRAKMGGGFSLLNELTVVQATQGLLRHIQEAFKDIKEPLSVVIGFDARHQSHRFARLAAALFAHEQFQVYLFDSTTVPTPFLAFSVRKLQCQAGIIITASHNPKEDNGYKVYWNNGAQIISPIDAKIAQSIERNLEPWKGKAWRLDILDKNKSKSVSNPIDKICDFYMAELTKLIHFPEINRTTPLKFVYTPVHGVGQPYAERAFTTFQFPPFISVQEQSEPDPNFSTVKYPNPEEGKTTFACAIQTANTHRADIILSTDPDADRFGLAERDTTLNREDEWRIFTGNQLGTLLGWWRWFTWRNRNPTVDVKDVYMLYSTVSSHILKSMSEVEGFNTIETLTGFKWLGNKSYDLMNEKKHVLFAFEESIGYMCDPCNVLDKDGISAMCVAAEMCAYLKSIGRTLVEQLDHLYELYSYHFNNNSYAFCNQTHVMVDIFHRLRHFNQDEKDQKKDATHKKLSGEHHTLVQYSNKIKSHLGANEDQPIDSKATDETYVYPRSLGNHQIIRIRDLTVGIDVDFREERKEEKPSLPCSSSNQMITFFFDNECEITIRASGTEPKIKWYSEVRKKNNAAKSSTDKTTETKEQFHQQTKQELEQLLQLVINEFLEAKKNKLTLRETTPK